MNKIRKGDQVYVIAGRDKGKRGVVTAVRDDDRVLVEGINMIKRHTKPNPTSGTPGGIIDKEAPIHISNVALFNPVTSKPDRVGIKILTDGRKVRIFKSTQEVVDL
jgi:large subunit ribosomal protein L24